MSLFSIAGNVSIDTRDASHNLTALNRDVISLNQSLGHLAGGGGSAAVANARATANASARVQIEAAKQVAREKELASKQAFAAQQQTERLTAQSARDTARQAAQAARDTARAEIGAKREAARVAQQTARESTRVTQEAARAQSAAWRQSVAEGKRAAGQLATSFARIAQVGGLAIVGAFGASLRVLDDYDRKMRNVNSIAQLGTKGFNELSLAVRKISADPNIKKGPRDLAEGLYDVYSAGFKGAEALDVLKESAISASAGVSTTKVGVDAITTALRAHIKGVNTAREASNYYFQTVNDGKITFTQLASAIGNGAAKVHAGGLSMAEFGAVMANATLKGVKSARAVTQLNNLIDKIAAPKPQAAQEFEKLGIKIGYSELKAVGFTAKMKEVMEKTHGSADALRKLIPDQRAFDAALTITSDNMASYNSLLEKQKHANDGVGAAARAAAKQNQGLSNDVDQAKKNLELFAITAASVVAPSVSRVLNEGTHLLRMFQALPKETQNSYIKMAAFGGAALLLVSPLKSLIETGILVGKVIRGMGAAKALETQATLAHTAALEANTAAILANNAAKGAGAEASGAAAAGNLAQAESAGAAAASTGAFGAAFVALSAVAVIATAAVFAYKINQEAVSENNARLKASNANLAASNRQTALSFDVLKKSASVDAGASKTVADLTAQYDKLKGSAAGLQKFKSVALPQARREIAVNVHLSMPQKAELNRQLDGVAGQIDANMGARRFDVQVKAEADKGALANVRTEFYRTYGWLYDQFKATFVQPYLDDWKMLTGAADSAGGFIKTHWGSMLTSLDSATGGWASRTAAAFQRVINAIGKSIADKANQAWNWYNGRTANHGETDGPSLPAAPPLVKGAPKSQVWLNAHNLPSYDVGTSYVPQDQIAYVHKGEIIIPAAQSERIRGRSYDLRNRIDGLDSQIDNRRLSNAKNGNNHRDPQLKIWIAERTQLKHELAEIKRESTDADREQRARTKAQRESLRAAAADYKASAKEVQDATEKTLDKLSKLRDGFKGLFEGAQSELAGLGDVSNPLGRRVASWEQFLGVAQSARAAVDAGNSVRDVAPSAGGGDYGAGASGGEPMRGSALSARNLFERFNLKSKVDMTCADVASATIGALGIHLKREAGAASLEAQVKALGWQRVDPRNAPLGSAVFKYSASARSKTHAMMGLGEGRLASSSNHKVSYFNARGSERAYAPPGGAGAGFDAGGFGGGGGYSARHFEMGDYRLSNYRSLGAGWGQGLRQNEDNGSRFALQTKLAGGEMEGEIGRVMERLRDKSATAKLLSQTGFTLKAELPLREQAISLLRQEANAQDAATNARRRGAQAADKANATLLDLNRARAAVGTEKNPLASLLAQFEKGGELEAAPAQKAILLGAQMRLSLAQIAQSTKEATDAEGARASALREAAPLLTQAGLASGDYDRALERVNRRFEVWRSPDLSGLLDAAKSYDALANAAGKAANALANKPGKLSTQERAEYNRLRAQASGYAGRAAGVRRQANTEATGRIEAGQSAADDALSREQVTKFFAQSEAAAASLGQRGSEAFLSLKRALKDTGASADDLLAAVKAVDPLLADLPGIAEQIDSVRRAAGERAKDEFSHLTDDARQARDQARLTLQYSPDDPALEREVAMLGERNRLTLESQKLSTEKRATFNQDGRLAAFGENFDAGVELHNAQTYRAAVAEAAQAVALFGQDSATAGLQYRTAFGDLKGMPPGWKAEMLDASATIARVASASEALSAAKGQRADLSKQMIEGYIGARKRKPLTALDQQEIDWQFDDARSAATNPGKPRSADEVASINKERNAVRGLMTDWDEFSKRRDKIQGIADGLTGSFMSGFDAVLSHQKSFGAAFMSSLNSMLLDAAKQVIQSQLQSAFLGLFGGGLKSLPGVVPIRGGGGGAPVIHGSHRSGLDSVPFDGYLAQLHRNERVLTEAEAKRWDADKSRDVQAATGAPVSYARASSGRASASESNGGGGFHVNGPVTIVANNTQQFEREMTRQTLPRRETRKQTRGALGF